MRVVQAILAVVSIIVITMMIDLFSIGDKDKPLIYTKTETSETYTYYRCGFAVSWGDILGRHI